MALMPGRRLLVRVATRNTVLSSNGRPAICSDTGSPALLKPIGSAMAGTFAMLKGYVLIRRSMICVPCRPATRPFRARRRCVRRDSAWSGTAARRNAHERRQDLLAHEHPRAHRAVIDRRRHQAPAASRVRVPTSRLVPVACAAALQHHRCDVRVGCQHQQRHRNTGPAAAKRPRPSHRGTQHLDRRAHRSAHFGSTPSGHVISRTTPSRRPLSRRSAPRDSPAPGAARQWIARVVSRDRAEEQSRCLRRCG